MKKIFYTVMGVATSTWLNSVSAQTPGDPVNDIWKPTYQNGQVSEYNGSASGMSGGQNLIGLINSFLKYAFSFMGLAAVFYAVWGGFKILTAKEDKSQIDKAKDMIIHAVIGIVIIIFSYTIVNFVLKGLIAVGNTGNK